MRIRFGRGLAALLGVAACAAVLGACGSSSSSSSASNTSNTSSAASSSSASTSTTANKSPINFALISFDIPAQNFVGYYYDGAEAAAKIINSEGGFGGHPVQIEECNDMLQPATTTDCAHSTIADHPVAMFGCSVAWDLTGLQIYSAAGIPSFNCSSTTAGYKAKLNFGLGSSTWGEAGGMLRWLCAHDPSVKRIAYAEQTDPQDQAVVPPLLNAIAKPCGMTISYTWVNDTSANVDLTATVTKMLQTKPQFILTVVSGEQMVTMAKILQQDHFPTSDLWINSSAADLPQDLKPAGTALNGVWIADEWLGWGIKGNPEVEAYQKALAGNPNVDSGNVEQGYMYMMYMYSVAKKLGFANFNSKTLANFSNTASGFSSPMLHGIVNPGPSWNTQMKNPFVQIMRWNGSAMVPVTTGTDDGWINTLTGKAA